MLKKGKTLLALSKKQNQNLGNLIKRGGYERLELIIMRHDILPIVPTFYHVTMYNPNEMVTPFLSYELHFQYLQSNILLQICNIFLVSHGFIVL